MPISVIFLLVFAVISLVGGVVFVITSLRSSRDDETAVPISNLKEIREIKAGFKENGVEPKQSVSLADHVIRQNLASGNNEGFKSDSSLMAKSSTAQSSLNLIQEQKKHLEVQIKSMKEDFSCKVKEYDSRNRVLTEENNRLSEVLNRENSSQETIALSDQEVFEREEAKKNLVQLQNSYENSTKENQSLGRLLEEKSAKLNDVKNYIDQMTKKVEKTSSLLEEKTKLYEGEILEIKKENEKLIKANEVFYSLKKEKESLQDHDDVLSIRLKRMAQKIVVLKQKNRHFREKKSSLEDEASQRNQELIYQLKLSEEKVYDLQENIEIVNMRNAQKLSEAQGQMDLLKSQLDDFQSREQQSQNNFADDQTTLTSEECNRLTQENEDSVRNFEKMKEFNEHLLEKEKILQYELTKARAQNLGLEKVCEEFKDQIEKSDKVKL